MAVYKRTYKGYSGGLTPTWSRFMILPRYSYARLFRSKFLVIFLIACYIFPIGCAGYIYLAHNLSFLKAMGAPASALKIDADFFLTFCAFQFVMSYLLTAFVGPGLVSPDLTNNALPLYLSRPFTRWEYVIGRMSVLLWLLSIITWVPGLLLFSVQSSLAGWDWMRDNLWLGAAIFVALFMWNLILSLLAVAVSAWIKWRVAAGAVIVAIFAIGAALGTVANQVLHTHYGSLINLSEATNTIWREVFRTAQLGRNISLTPVEAWLSIAGFCALALWMLTRKVRAFEVVK